MDDFDDEFPYSSSDLTPLLVEPNAPVPESALLTVDEINTILRLIVGTAIEGNDEYKRRVRLWQQSSQAASLKRVMIVPLPGETDSNRLFYALLGLLFLTPNYISRRLSSVNRSSSSATSFMFRIFSPVMNSRMMGPVKNRFELSVMRGESIVDNLVNVGRSEAQASRRLVQEQVNDEMLNEILVTLVERAKLRELIEQQGVEAAGDVVDEFRVRSASVDNSLEKIVNSVLKRQPDENSSSNLQV